MTKKSGRGQIFIYFIELLFFSTIFPDKRRDLQRRKKFEVWSFPIDSTRGFLDHRILNEDESFMMAVMLICMWRFKFQWFNYSFNYKLWSTMHWSVFIVKQSITVERFFVQILQNYSFGCIHYRIIFANVWNFTYVTLIDVIHWITSYVSISAKVSSYY